MITVGVIHKEPKVMEDGSIRVRDVMNLGFTADERIADGFYFARSLKLAEYILTNPSLLDIPLSEEIDYAY
jgi:pyruvate/2-oxoglutarate dehydrogenase complex dihydrolipoamide acyltransferase (E2) component